MANPVLEILPDEAKKGGAAIVGTGCSDYPTCNPGMYIGGVLFDDLITDSEKDKIFSLNAKKYFDIHIDLVSKNCIIFIDRKKYIEEV